MCHNGFEMSRYPLLVLSETAQYPITRFIPVCLCALWGRPVYRALCRQSCEHLQLSPCRGTMGWALETRGIDKEKYKYFIFMNSSARGPFLPPHWPQHIHWSALHISCSLCSGAVQGFFLV